MSSFSWPSSSGSANASVGTNTTTAPAFSTEVGFIDGSGNLQGVSPSQPLPVSVITGPNPTNVNIADVAGTATPVGAGASNAGTQRVILSSDSPLAAGAATAANQATQITEETAIAASTASIDTKTPALGQALATGSTPVVLTAAQIATLTPLTSVAVTQATASSLNGTVVTTGGATIAKDSSLTTINTTLGSPFQAGASIGNSSFGISGSLPAGSNALGSVSVSNFPATQPVSGTVAVSNFPATQPVSAVSLPLPTGAATSALQSTINTTLGTPMQQTGGSVTANAGTNLNTSLLALESGGNLASINTKLPAALGQAAAASSLGVTLSNENVQDLYVTGAAAQTAQVNNILTASSGSAATDCTGYRSASIQVISTGTGGTFIFETSNDNVNFVSQLTTTTGNTNGAVAIGNITATSSNLIYLFPITARYLRLRIVTTITGGNIQAFTRLSQTPYASSVPAVVTTNGTMAQPSVATDLSGAITSTTTSALIAPTQGSTYFVIIDVTVVAGTLPTYSVAVQESLDSGTNWTTFYTFPLITATGSYASPMMQLTGRDIRYVQTITGSAGQSFTRTVNRAQASSAIPSLYRNYIDTAINPVTTNSVTASLQVEGTNTYSAIVNQGSGGSAVVFALDGSDDNSNWVQNLAQCTGVVGGATPVAMSFSGTSFRFIRARVVTGVGSTTISYVSLVGNHGAGKAGGSGTTTNRSGTTSGTPSTSTQIMAANYGRRYLLVQNLGTSAIYINFTASADTTNSILLAASGGSYVAEGAFVPTEVVNVISAGTSIAYCAKEA